MSDPRTDGLELKHDDSIEVNHGDKPGLRAFVWRTNDDTIRVTIMNIADSIAFDVTYEGIKEIPFD